MPEAATVPLSAAVGRAIHCPDPGCGAIGVAEPSRAPAAPPGSLPPPPGVAPPAGVLSPRVQWCVVRCPRTGAKLFPAQTLVRLYIDG